MALDIKPYHLRNKTSPTREFWSFNVGKLYSTANDPETANDPQNRPQMIPWTIEGMDWIFRDWSQKRTDYKKEPSSLAF